MKIYNYDTISSSEGDTISLASNSKFEGHVITTINSAKGNTFEVVDSDLFLTEVTNCIAGKGIVLNATNSTIRGVDVENIVGSKSDAIALDGTKMSLSTLTTIVSGDGKAINAVNSELNISTIDTISSAQNIAVYLTGTTVSLIRDAALVTAGQKTAVHIENGAWGQFNNTELITSGNGVAVKVTDGRYTDDTGDMRQGYSQAIEGISSTIEVQNIQYLTSAELVAVELTDCTYYFSYAINFTGKNGAFFGTNCKGALQFVEEMSAGEDVAVKTIGCSGPLEWDTIDLITSGTQNGWEVSGDLKGFRAANILKIESPLETALDWNQEGGDAYLYNVGTIEAPIKTAANITVTGKFRLEKLGSILAEEEKALVVSVSEGSELQIDDFESISSEMETAISGTSQGKLSITNGTTIESQMVSGVLLDGEGALYSTIRFAEIDSIKATEATDHLVKITNCSFLQLHKVASFELGTGSDTSYIAYLTGNSGKFGRCEVIDCQSFTATKGRGGLYLRDFFDFDVVCSREKGNIIIEECTGGYLFAAIGCNGRIANFKDIVDHSNKATMGIFVYGALDGCPGNVQIWNIDSIQSKENAVFIATYGCVEMHNVTEIRTPEGSPAVRIENGQILVQGGSTPTRLSAKDINSSALEIQGTNKVTLTSIKTEASKGKVFIDDSDVTLRKVEINGDFEVDDSTVEARKSTFNTSVKATAARIEFYNCNIDLAAQAGTYQDFSFDPTSSIYLHRTPIMGSGVVVGEGVLHGDIETITTDINVGAGVVLLNKSNVSQTTFNSTTSFLHKVDVTGDITSTTGSHFWNDVVVSGRTTLDADGIIANNLDVSHGLYFTGDEGGIFNRFNGHAGSINLSEDSGTIFNHLKVVWAINVPNNAGAIFNQVLEMNSDFEILADSGCILNRINGNVNTDFTINGTSGVIASYLKGNDLELTAQTGSDAGGLLGSYIFLEGDLDINKNTSVLADALIVEGDITINAEGSMASIGGQFSNPPEGDGVMLDIGPVAGAFAPREEIRASLPADWQWPILVTGLHIHADSDPTKSAITTRANWGALTVCGDAFSGKMDVVSSGHDAGVLEGGGEGTFVRQMSQFYNAFTRWPSTYYSNEMKLWYTDSSTMGIEFYSGHHRPTPMDAQGYFSVASGLFGLSRKTKALAPTHVNILTNSGYGGSYPDEDYIFFGQDASIEAPTELILISREPGVPPTNASIILHGDTGIQNRYASVLIDDNAPAIDHNYT